MAIQVLTAASPTPILVEIGGFVSPMPAPLLLTAVPTNDALLILNGELFSSTSTGAVRIAAPITLTRSADVNGAPAWSAPNWTVSYSTTHSRWEIGTEDFSYLAYNTTPASDPSQLTNWAILSGSGVPTLTFAPSPAITAIGQLAMATVGSEASVWIALTLRQWLVLAFFTLPISPP